MFKINTVFILGAGASCPYGYPTGGQLIKDIIKNIRNDEIYVPVNRNPTCGTIYDLIEIADKFKNPEGNYSAILDFKLEKYSISGTTNCYALFRDPNRLYQKLKLSDLKIGNVSFMLLAQKIEEFDPVSIDNFLHDHKDLAEVGRIMICYSILKVENKNYFEKQQQIVKFENKDKNNDNKGENNWYKLLLHGITSGCGKNPEELKSCNRGLSIITFNYDVSLEFFLLSRLKGMPTFNTDGKNYGSDFAQEFITNNIKHLYGKLYSMDHSSLETYGSYDSKENIKDNDNCVCNLARLLRAYNIRNNIQLIEERNQSIDDASVKLLKNSTNIYILGFGFDKTNLTLLNLENTLSSNEPGSKKNIFLFNYDNQMHNLVKNFNDLKEANKLSYRYRIYESTKHNIEQAMAFDFNAFW